MLGEAPSSCIRGTSPPASRRSPATEFMPRRAIAVVSTMSGADFRQWEPVFPEWGTAREDFDELVDDLSFVTDAIVNDVSLDGVVSNLFGGESD